MSQRVRDVALLIVAGLFAGSLSGLFGIGGGTVIIPALMAVGYSQARGLGIKFVSHRSNLYFWGDLLCRCRQNRLDPCAFDDSGDGDRCTGGNVGACAAV